MASAEPRDRLLELLRTLAFAEREVTLSSGKKSNFYIDCKQVSLDAEGAWLIGQLFHRAIEELAPVAEGVGGLTLGADPLATHRVRQALPPRLVDDPAQRLRIDAPPVRPVRHHDRLGRLGEPPPERPVQHLGHPHVVFDQRGRLAVDGPQPAIRLAMGEALLKQGATADAIEHLRAAADAGFRVDVAGPLLVRALVLAGRSHEAASRLPAIPDSAASGPSGADLALDLGTVALEQGAAYEAMRWMRIAVTRMRTSMS